MTVNQVLVSALANDDEFARGILRLSIRDSGMTPAVWARAAGLTPQFVCAVLKGRKKPSDKLCAAIGLRKIVCYIYDHERAEALG